MTYLRLIFFAICSMCLWSKSAVACQEGVGGQDVNSPREVQAEGVIITWSETNDELRGFSQKLGDWEVLKIDPQKLNPQQEITPVVASNIAAVRFGDSIAAFSGEKGWWDVVELSKDSTAVPVVSPSLAVFEDNGHLYTFSSNKGRWSSPTDPELQSLTEHVDLQGHPNAVKAVMFAEVAFQKWLETLPKYKARGIRAQFSGSGAVYLHVDRRSCLAEATVAVEKALTRWQTVDGENALKRPTSSGQSEISSVKEIESSIASLRNKMLHLDNSLRDVSASPRVQESSASQTSAELRKLVEQSFDLRQQLQELEAQRLRLKLQQVENNLAVRAKSRDAMVERRIEELRRPDSGNKVLPQEQDSRSTSRDKAPDLYLVEPIQQMQPLTTFGDDDSARISNGLGTWNEVLDVIKLLEDKKKSYEPLQSAVQSYQQKQVRFARPFNDWTAEERQEFENTLKALLQEKPVNTELAADLDEVLVEYRNVYIRLGIINADSEEVQSELSAETRERVRTDLVKHQVSHKEVYSEKAANVVREWTTVWNLYVARRRELELSVERGEERLSEMDRQAEKILVGDKKTAKSVESQKRQAQLIVEQLRARLQPFLDLEKDHPELKPPGIHATDAAPEAEPSASMAKVADNLPQQVISMAEQLRKLRDAAVKIREERQPHENLITQYSRPLEQLKAEGVVDGTTTEEDLKTQIARSKPEFDRLTTSFENSARAWKQAWNAYRSQSKLFELNVREAEAASVSAKQTFDHVQAKFRQGLVGAQEIQTAEANLNAASLQLEKARATLEMWQDLEKNDSNVNPDWKPSSSPAAKEAVPE